MLEISVTELKEWENQGLRFKLLDVREAFEHEHFNIGGLLIPLGALIRSRDLIPKDIPVVIYCEKGIRSIIAIQRLTEHGFSNLYNLKGGMKAWRNRFDDLKI